MHSALCLHYGALHIPSATNIAASIARPYSSFRPSFLSLSCKASTYRTLSRYAFSSPVICALDKPSTPSPNYDKDNGKKIVRVVGGASVVLAFVLGIINCNYNFSPRAIAAPRTETTPLVLSQPKAALESLLNVNKHLATTKSHSWTTPKLELPDRPSPGDLEKFKNDVANLIKSGMSDKAEKQLRVIKTKQGGIPGNEAEMELVLLLIFQERYKDALECDCLKGSAVVSDARVHLYKAIIYTMMDDNSAAEDSWKLFISSFSTTEMLSEKSEVKPKPPRKKF
ncbi:hypothetical protein M0R45_013605 [Rubus argutus]|uniref:Uncharacterized protein n=1 Tax=Rubus argutus TaxID=59490 RepID=A0AAW1XIT0_RUBAR